MNQDSNTPLEKNMRVDFRYPELVAALASINDGPRTECAILNYSAGGALVWIQGAQIGAKVLIDIPKFERQILATVVGLGGDGQVHLRFIDLSTAEQLSLAKILDGREASR